MSIKTIRVGLGTSNTPTGNVTNNYGSQTNMHTACYRIAKTQSIVVFLLSEHWKGAELEVPLTAIWGEKMSVVIIRVI